MAAFLRMLFLLWSTVTAVQSIYVRIDVNASYGISEAGIYSAVEEAARHLKQNCQDQVELYFAPGVWIINQTKIGIDLSHIQPCEQGRIIVSGADRDTTTLTYTNWHQDTLYARNTRKVTIQNIHFTRSYQTVTQGDLIQNDPGSLVIRLHDGFPTPNELYDACFPAGRFVREYDQNVTDPKIIANTSSSVWPPSINKQLPWNGTEQIDTRTWRIYYLRLPNEMGSFTVGNVIGVKSKQCAQAYQFFGGDDFAFFNVRWTKISRGVFRNISNVHLDNTQILRSEPVVGRVPCMSTYAGGPQFDGQDVPNGTLRLA
jgi:hypothetical protein